MTMRVECCECGEDCSHAYATHRGYPYHFGCLPLPKRNKSSAKDKPLPAPPASPSPAGKE